MVGVVGSILAGVGVPLGLLLESIGLVCGLVFGLVESMELNFFMILVGSFLPTGSVITVIQGSLLLFLVGF